MSDALLQIQKLSKEYALGSKRKVKALDRVSLFINKGETLGIVGESGCGKSTLARIIMGAEKAQSGKIVFDGELLQLKSRKNRLEFAKKAQMIFQDSYASLDPRMMIKDSIAENLILHGVKKKSEIDSAVNRILEQVGLSAQMGERFPHELSGGQRQRVGIARALVIKPDFLICDEPVSALDLSVQSQILNLLKHLKDEMGLTYLFIAHDLNLVQYISDRIAVFYRGNMVELAEADELCRNPLHPYTSILFESALTPAGTWEGDLSFVEENVMQGEMGCPYAGQCRFAVGKCRTEKPQLKEISPGHFVACRGK